MSMKDLIESATKAVPGLKAVPEQKAVALLREVFRQIGQQLEGTSDGVVKVAGLGNFRVKLVEKEVDGQKTQSKRVVFKAAKAKEKVARPAGAGKSKGKGKGKGKAAG